MEAIFFMQRRPTGNDRLTAVTDGGGRRVAMMGGSDRPWLERIDGRGRWAMRRASRHTEETGGWGWRTLSWGYGQAGGRWVEGRADLSMAGSWRKPADMAGGHRAL